MKSHHLPPSPAPGPDCASFASLLPVLAEEGIDASELARLHEHLKTCVHCQAQRRDYERLDDEIFRQFGAAAVPQLSLNEIFRGFQDELPATVRAEAMPAGYRSENQRNVDGHARSPGERPPAERRLPPLERRGRMDKLSPFGKRWSALQRFSAVAAVLLLLALVSSLVVGLVLVRHKSIAGHPTQTATPAATPPPLPPAIYIGASSGIYKVDAKTGAQDWYYHVGDYAGAAPTFVNGVVYFSAQNRSVYALKAQDGSLLWRYQRPDDEDTSSTPAVANGVVYLGGSLAGAVHALKASDGSLLWRTTLASSSTPYDYLDTGTAIAANGLVYVSFTHDPSTNGSYCSIYALDASTGQIVWHADLPREQILFQVEVIAGTLYASSENIKHGGIVDVFDSYVYAYNAQNGALLWQSPNLHAENGSVPAIANGVAYIGSYNGYLYALNTKDGAVLWHTRLLSAGISVTPHVVDGLLYILGSSIPNGGDDLLLAVNASNGTVRWQQQAFGYFASLAVNGGVLYALDMATRQLLTFKASDGSPIWKVQYSQIGGELGGSLIFVP